MGYRRIATSSRTPPIARALKKCIKGLTPNQVRAWLSRDEAWLDAVVAELGPRALALW